MYRYKVTVSYLGKNYSGWQKQMKSESIQEAIEKTINKITNEDNVIVASGRTDSKVNAKGQVFHFDSSINMNSKKWKHALNAFLPEDIHINDVEKVNGLFHARYCVLYKRYQYLINMGEYDVFSKDYVYHSNVKLDINKMILASKHFIGVHDFTSFCANPIDKYPNQVREIYNIDFKVENDVLSIVFKGNGFLRYMVRMIVGALIEVGKGKLTSEDILKILNKKDKDAFNKNAKANGLTLLEVKYFDLLYLDDYYLIRTIHQEDERLINEFYIKYGKKIELCNKSYILSYRNKEDVVCIINYDEKIYFYTIDETVVLNEKMEHYIRCF